MRSLPIIRGLQDLPDLSRLVSKGVILKAHDHRHHQELSIHKHLLQGIAKMTDQVIGTTIPLLHVTADMIAEEAVAAAVAVEGQEVIITMTETEIAVNEAKNENSISHKQIEVVRIEKGVEVGVEVAVQKEKNLLGIVTEGEIIEAEHNL